MSHQQHIRTVLNEDGGMSHRRYEELARRLYAAAISHQMRVTYRTAEKHLRKEDRMPGEYWHRLAERVAGEIARMHAEPYAKTLRAANVKAVKHLSLVPKS